MSRFIAIEPTSLSGTNADSHIRVGLITSIRSPWRSPTSCRASCAPLSSNALVAAVAFPADSVEEGRS
jgi:hypothetical protein